LEAFGILSSFTIDKFKLVKEVNVNSSNKPFPLFHTIISLIADFVVFYLQVQQTGDAMAFVDLYGWEIRMIFEFFKAFEEILREIRAEDIPAQAQSKIDSTLQMLKSAEEIFFKKEERIHFRFSGMLAEYSSKPGLIMHALESGLVANYQARLV
jgi:hypothetical protein